MPPNLEDQKLGQILIAKGLATKKQIAEAMADQTQGALQSAGQKFKLGQLLVFKQIISPAQLQEALRSQTNKMTTMRSDPLPPVQLKPLNRQEKPQTLLGRMSAIFFKKR